MDAGRDRPRTAHALRAIGLACVAVAFGLAYGSSTPDSPSGGSTAAEAHPVPAPIGEIRTASEVERPPAATALPRRIRTRTRYGDVLSGSRWDPRLVSPTAGAGLLQTAEALRILQVRATLVLSWGGIHRDARSGALHAHSFGCPPPLRS